MSVKRVLIIHSTNDGTFDSRLKQIASNAYLDEISFRHLCVLDESRDSPLTKAFDEPMDAARQKEVLAQILTDEVGPLAIDQIQQFDPDVLIVHRGIVFNLVPGAFLGMLNRIKARFPDLPFAMERKNHWPSIGNRNAAAVLSAGEEDRWAKALFIETPEVEAIIKAVFN